MEKLYITTKNDQERRGLLGMLVAHGFKHRLDYNEISSDVDEIIKDTPHYSWPIVTVYNVGFEKYINFTAHSNIGQMAWPKDCGKILDALLGSEVVKLNDEYSATVSKDGVEVGCQKFDFETIDKLVNVIKKYR